MADPAGSEQRESEGRGRVDLVSVLYIVGGIPAIVAYVVICFMLARFFDFPA